MSVIFHSLWLQPYFCRDPPTALKPNNQSLDSLSELQASLEDGIAYIQWLGIFPLQWLVVVSSGTKTLNAVKSTTSDLLKNLLRPTNNNVKAPGSTPHQGEPSAATEKALALHWISVVDSRVHDLLSVFQTDPENNRKVI